MAIQEEFKKKEELKKYIAYKEKKEMKLNADAARTKVFTKELVQATESGSCSAITKPMTNIIKDTQGMSLESSIFISLFIA